MGSTRRQGPDGTHDNDTWDLASSVGATATMVAAARAIATTADDALINDPFAEPLVRAVGVDFFTRLATGELTPRTSTRTTPVGMQRMTDNMAVRTMFFDEFFLDATAARGPAGGDPGVGAGRARVPAAVARGHHGVRDRSARGHRVQDRDAGRVRCRTDRRAPHGRDRPAPRLAVGADRRGLRPEPTDGVERRGSARLPAARRAGPAARHHHRAQRRGQPGRRGERADPRPRRTRSG